MVGLGELVHVLRAALLVDAVHEREREGQDAKLMTMAVSTMAWGSGSAAPGGGALAPSTMSGGSPRVRPAAMKMTRLAALPSRLSPRASFRMLRRSMR